MSVFETIKRKPSVLIAKDRLKVLLVSDRINCTPDAIEKIPFELYKTLSKYVEITPDEFDVQITRSAIFINLQEKTREIN